MKSLSHVRPSATPWTAAFQAPPSVGFSRQEYWSGVPLPSPWNRQRVWQIGNPLLHCGWECKLVQPLWRIVWGFLKKLKIELPYDPATPRTAAFQAPPSVGFSRQDYWTGLPLPSPHGSTNGIFKSAFIHWALNMYKHITYLTYVFKLQEVGFIIIRLPRWLIGKQFACQAGEAGSIPGLGRCPGEGNDNPLQYSSLGNPMESGAW